LGKTVLRRIETVMTGFDFMSVCLSFVWGKEIVSDCDVFRNLIWFRLFLSLWNCGFWVFGCLLSEFVCLFWRYQSADTFEISQFCLCLLL
jgi:hypothetical protein